MAKYGFVKVALKFGRIGECKMLILANWKSIKLSCESKIKTQSKSKKCRLPNASFSKSIVTTMHVQKPQEVKSKSKNKIQTWNLR